jgi:hypothetical protein
VLDDLAVGVEAEDVNALAAQRPAANRAATNVTTRNGVKIFIDSPFPEISGSSLTSLRTRDGMSGKEADSGI